MVGVVTVVLGAFGALCTGAGAYAVAHYYRFARLPIREPTDVDGGDHVGIAGTVAASSPTTTAPISGAAVPLAHWRVDRAKHGDGDPWATIGEGVDAPDEIRIEVAGYEVPVELPAAPDDDVVKLGAFAGGLDRSGIDYHELVRDSDEAPPEIESFSRTADLAIDIGDRKKRYMEAHLEPGDDVTVYGTVEVTSGDQPAASNVALTGDVVVSSDPTDETLQRYLYAGVWGFVFGLPSLAGAVLLAV